MRTGGARGTTRPRDPTDPPVLRAPLSIVAVAAMAGLLAAVALEASRPPQVSRGIDLAAAARGAGPSPSGRGAHTRDAGARRVEVAGCRAVIAGPSGTGPAVCEAPPDGALRVWVDAADDEHVAVESNGGAVEPRPLPAGQGRLFHVRVRPEAPWLSVSVGAPAASAASPPLAAAQAPDALDALVARRRSDPREAERLATPLLAAPDPATRARASGLVARIRRDRGDLAGARDLFERAIERDALAGRISDLYADSFALTYTLGVQLRRFDEARAALERLAPLREAGLASPQHEAHARYYAALVAHEAGDLRGALAHYRAAREGAARLSDPRLRADVLSQEARALLDLGRAAEAGALYDEAAPLAEDLDPCAKATFFNNWASFLLDAGSASPEAHVRSPGDPLASAIALVERDCPVERLRGYVALSLAQVRLHAEDPGAARAALDVAAAALTPADKLDAAELADVAAHVAMAEGDLRAAWDANEQLAEIAGSAVLPHYRRRAALERARLLADAGDAAAADAAYEDVARIIAEDSLAAPLGEGRLGFLERLGRGASRYVAFLLSRSGGAALAADVARRSIAHMLYSLETVERIGRLSGAERRAFEARLAAYRLERARIESEAAGDWRLSAIERARAAEARRAREQRARAALDEALAEATLHAPARRDLTAPADGELFLVYFPLEGAEWVGFAIEPAGTSARALPEGTPSERFLAPFRAEIDRARHVRFFVPRALRAVDFHALPYDRGVLAERVPITYGLDVRVPVEARAGEDALRPGSRAGAALIVADPQGSLPEARREAETVREKLAASGFEVSLLTALGPEKASHARVVTLLEPGGISLFHFAGHARFSGADGWDSQLPLAGDGALRVGDVLSLPAVPRVVVLSGCETGRSDGLGLAHAFVAAGASAAIGITREVPDPDAHDVMRLFYESLSWSTPPATATAAALGAAIRKLRREGGGRAAWESYRVFVP